MPASWQLLPFAAPSAEAGAVPFGVLPTTLQVPGFSRQLGKGLFGQPGYSCNGTLK